MSLRSSTHGERTRAGGFIHRRKDGQLEVLLMRRFKPERGEYWVIPGGSVEDGESVEAAAGRELEEETGVNFLLQGKLYESVNPSSGRVAHYFAALWQHGEPRLQADSPEAAERNELTNRYTPTWVQAEAVCALPLFPTIIRDRLCHDLQRGMPKETLRLEETD
jgi:8-oxo-dGTP diphosphatase